MWGGSNPWSLEASIQLFVNQLPDSTRNQVSSPFLATPQNHPTLLSTSHPFLQPSVSTGYTLLFLLPTSTKTYHSYFYCPRTF
ncbi:hypothetical protein M8J76_015585 [Diaphorina citri]|nr:hypothetical protein M8J76_015585 [Diaphorina citri]